MYFYLKMSSFASNSKECCPSISKRLFYQDINLIKVRNLKIYPINLLLADVSQHTEGFIIYSLSKLSTLNTVCK